MSKYENFILVFLIISVLFLLYKSFSTTTTKAGTSTSSNTIQATIFNNLKDESNLLSANEWHPIPNLKGTEAGVGDQTLISAMNFTTSTFTAPTKASYTFDLAIAFCIGSATTAYYTAFSTNALNGQTILHMVNGTIGSNSVNNSCTLLLNKGQTVQFQASSPNSWGNYTSTLNIVARPTA